MATNPMPSASSTPGASHRSGVTRSRPIGRAQDTEVNLALARERALRALRSRLPELATIIATALPAMEPAYRSTGIPGQELRTMVEKSVQNALTALCVPVGDREEFLDTPRAVGERRLQQGVPVDTIMRAYHLGGEVVAGALAQWAVDEATPSESVLVLDDLWSVVDEHSAAAVDALRTAGTSPPGGQTTGILLDALLNGAGGSAGIVSAVANAYALPEEGTYAVIVRRPTDDGPLIEPSGLPARAAGIRLIWRMHGQCAVGVAVLGALPVPALTGGLDRGNDFRTGVSLAVEGLADLGRARQLAELASRTLTHGCGVAVLEEHLQAAILTAQPDLAHELKLHVLAPVLELDSMSRDLLLDTLAAWLRSDGSTAQAALSLYCHRNTVQNRLRRLERLTRRSLAVPRDLIELSLALDAFELQRHVTARRRACSNRPPARADR